MCSLTPRQPACLQDKKTGKLTAAPLPQPTLPKVGLSTKDLYAARAESEAGSGREVAPSSRYQYPPSSGRYGPQGGSPLLSRNAYPYNYSEPDSLHKGYADSVTSLDGFANRGAAMGFSDSSTNLMATVAAHDMQRLPSYRSETGSMKSRDGRAAPYKEKGQREVDDDGGSATGDWDVLDYVPTLLGSQSTRNFRSQSETPPSSTLPYEYDGEYRAPSRQQLYERAARQQQSNGSGGHSESGSVNYGHGAGGGSWEDSTSRYGMPAQPSRQLSSRQDDWHGEREANQGWHSSRDLVGGRGYDAGGRPQEARLHMGQREVQHQHSVSHQDRGRGHRGGHFGGSSGAGSQDRQ